jgi:hypothetical protein
MDKPAKYFHNRDPIGSVFGPMLSRTFPIGDEPLPDSMEKLLRLLPDDGELQQPEAARREMGHTSEQ